MAADACANTADINNQIRTMIQEIETMTANLEMLRGTYPMVKQSCNDLTAAANAAAEAEWAAAVKADSGKRVNLYFNALFDRSKDLYSTLPKDFYAVYSDYDKIKIKDLVTLTKYAATQIPTLNRKNGFKFPAKNLFVKDISFEGRWGESWDTVYSNKYTKSPDTSGRPDLFANMCVDDGSSVIMIDASNNYITGSSNNKIVGATKDPNTNIYSCTNDLKYPKEGINLNNLVVLGWGKTWGFMSNGYLQWGLSPPTGAPAGTPYANLRMSFTIV